MNHRQRTSERPRAIGVLSLTPVLLVLAGVSCSGPVENTASIKTSNVARYSDLRRLIKENFHLSLECGCVTGDPDTVAAVKREVTEGDIPVLVDLLADEDDKIAGVASSVVTKFGEKALPLLREAERSRRGYQGLLATTAIAGIEGRMRRDARPPTQ
jgi:hypothetical protein